MTPETHHEQIDQENQETLQDLLPARMKLAIQYTLIQAPEEEVEAHIQAAPYERNIGKTIVMGLTHAVWGPRWAKSKTCRCRGPAGDLRASCLIVIAGAKQN